MESSGGNLKSNDGIAKLGGENRRRGAEGASEEAKHKEEEGTERREQESYCETSGQLKVGGDQDLCASWGCR